MRNVDGTLLRVVEVLLCTRACGVCRPSRRRWRRHVFAPRERCRRRRRNRTLTSPLRGGTRSIGPGCTSPLLLPRLSNGPMARHRFSTPFQPVYLPLVRRGGYYVLVCACICVTSVHAHIPIHTPRCLCVSYHVEWGRFYFFLFVRGREARTSIRTLCCRFNRIYYLPTVPDIGETTMTTVTSRSSEDVRITTGATRILFYTVLYDASVVKFTNVSKCCLATFFYKTS